MIPAGSLWLTECKSEPVSLKGGGSERPGQPSREALNADVNDLLVRPHFLTQGLICLIAVINMVLQNY